MADSLRNGETETRRYGVIAIYRRGETSFPESPGRPISVSQKVWYDQALTRMGEE